jgi:TM2 domain-containing membrane protein YozV
LLIVGLGQIYNGEVGKGLLMLIGCVVLWTVFLGWIINIWAIIDAYSVANRKHEAYVRWMEANAAAARVQASG